MGALGRISLPLRPSCRPMMETHHLSFVRDAQSIGCRSCIGVGSLSFVVVSHSAAVVLRAMFFLADNGFLVVADAGSRAMNFGSALSRSALFGKVLSSCVGVHLLRLSVDFRVDLRLAEWVAVWIEVCLGVSVRLH